MEHLRTLEQLHSHYGVAAPTSRRKVAEHLTPEYRAWIERSHFAVLSTVGPEGTDASPRGDDGPVVQALDDATLAMPDWHGNNRLDSLRNIVRNPRVSLMFMIPGSDNVIRVNGQGAVSVQADLIARFDRAGKRPRSVIVIRIEEIYFQCARALVRSRLWTSGDQSEGLPTAGQFLAAMTKGALGGPDYDREWPDRARKTLW